MAVTANRLAEQPRTDSCDPMAYSPLPTVFSMENTGVGCHALLQGIFPTQESHLSLLHCRQILYRLSYEGSPQLIVRTP